MRKVITGAQKQEIAELANAGHSDALIAYGADLYRDGLIQGAAYVVAGFTAIWFVCDCCTAVGKILKNKFKKKGS